MATISSLGDGGTLSDFDKIPVARTGGTNAYILGSEFKNIAPVGSVMFYTGPTAPPGWITCDGSALVVSFANTRLRNFLIGLTPSMPFGQDGSSNPRVPDLRGEFLRGWDGVRGIDAGRVFGSSQGFALQQPLLTNGGTYGSLFVSTSRVARFPATDSINGMVEGGEFSAGTSVSRANPTLSNETRPRNVALLPIIKL